MHSLPKHRLSHLRELEAESIHIFREVVAEFKNPAMLYSVGKDSSVMLHLAKKSFFPSKPQIPISTELSFRYPLYSSLVIIMFITKYFINDNQN